MKKYYLLLITFSLCILSCNAQSDPIVPAGTVTCKIGGKKKRAPFKKFVADGNKISVVETLAISQASFSINSIVNDEEEIRDANLSILIPVFTLDDLFNAGREKIDSNNSEVNLKLTDKISGEETLVQNLDIKNERTNIRGRINIKDQGNGTVKGNMRIAVFETTKTISSGEEESTKDESNGKIVLKCKFKDVPFEITQI